MELVSPVEEASSPLSLAIEEISQDPKEKAINKIVSDILAQPKTRSAHASILEPAKPEPKKTTYVKISFPNIAQKTVDLALAREKMGSQKLQKHSKEIKAHTGNIDLLLDFSSEISHLPDGESHEPSAKMKEIAEKLKANGINLLKEEGKINKSDLKSLVSSKIDHERTTLQTKINTEVQPEMQNLNAIMNTVQQVIQLMGRLIRTINERSVK